MGPLFIVRIYLVWDQWVLVAPAQSASTQPHKCTTKRWCFCENHESCEWCDSKGREDKTKHVQQQHVVLSSSWKFHILTELGICLTKVWACHCYKISQAADNTTSTLMEIRGRILVIIVFVKVRVGLHSCKARSGIPEIVSE